MAVHYTKTDKVDGLAQSSKRHFSKTPLRHRVSYLHTHMGETK
jgi:hypothetical protein